MDFNSYHFAIFFPIVFTLYWLLQSKKIIWQNTLLMFASFYFYTGFYFSAKGWDKMFTLLLLFSIVINYVTGILITDKKYISYKKIIFWIAIFLNVATLCWFKYFDFFSKSFAEVLQHLGISAQPFLLHWIIPAGISFYTFHGLSYIIDVYKGRIDSEKNFIDYAVFVSFFPLLVMGPIERATHLLPQIKQKRHFHYEKATDGLRQILWGFFKKVVIANQCAEYVNMTFDHTNLYSGSNLLMGAFFFAVQIYCDFSGYSDMALGIARLLGFDLLRNFAFPYFSRDIAEFWRRWHISLSSWFKDYLYIPLGGSKGGLWSKIRNTFIIFLVSGIWHGSKWNFVVWGGLNALYFIPLMLFNSNRNHMEIVAKGKWLPSIREVFQMGITFALTLLAWIFFRANTFEGAITFLQKMFRPELFTKPSIFPKDLLIIIIIFFTIEWLGREGQFALQNLPKRVPVWGRWIFYALIIIALFVFSGKEQPFIYFQF